VQGKYRLAAVKGFARGTQPQVVESRDKPTVFVPSGCCNKDHELVAKITDFFPHHPGSWESTDNQ
jgi:hypothetical protein